MYPSELCYLSYRGRLFKTLSHFLITVLTLLLIIVNFNNFFVQPAPVIWQGKGKAEKASSHLFGGREMPSLFFNLLKK